MIKPQPYLTDEGIAIFEEIVKALPDVGEEIDTYELSMLAHGYYIYQHYADELKIGMAHSDLNLVDQGRIIAIMDKAWKQITKQNHEYGMTPIGRDKLSKISVQDKGDDKLKKYA